MTNLRFADEVVNVTSEDEAGGAVWVHDYHLMLLPKMLHDLEVERYGSRKCRMVFFLHIPFPTSQIFRTLSAGARLLEGMVSADVVGFHAFDHARHFLNACKRLLGLKYKSRKGGLIGVEHNGRVVMVVMSHVGIEPPLINAGLADPRSAAARDAIAAAHGGRRVVAGYDPCERLQGVALKLLAFEKFLADFPLWQGRVVLVQRSVRSGARPGDEEHTSQEVRALVRRINEEFPGAVDYEEAPRKLPLHARLGLYLASDILLSTAVREGLNLAPLEFIFAKQEPEPPGVVVASEFSACTSMLSGALRVNPFNLESVANSLDQALGMAAIEKTHRRDRDLHFVGSRPSALWTTQVLQDMAVLSREERRVDGVTDMEHPEAVSFKGHHTGGRDAGFAPLSPAALELSYGVSRSRLLLLDYGGTLLRKEELGKYLKSNMTACKSQRPRPYVFDRLRELSRDPRNVVMVVSSLQAETLENVFAELPDVGLGASYGHSYSWPARLTGGVRSWELYDYGVDWEGVHAVAMPIMERYAWHTNGSSAHVRAAGLEWSYYSTDPEWGTIQANKLCAELEAALRPYDVKVHHNRGMVEVLPRNLNKGLVAKLALDKCANTVMFEGDAVGRAPEFVLCIGDDASDEHMFIQLYDFMAEAQTGDSDVFDGHAMPLSQVHTVSVGMRPTNATRYLTAGVDSVEDLLQRMANVRADA